MITAPRGTRELTRSYLLRAFRSRTSLFWNFAFPLFWLFLFAFVFGTGGAAPVGAAEEMGEGITYLMPGLFAITTLAISFAGVSYRLISEREQGILRRYRATPVSALSVVVANGAGALVILAVALALLGVVAWAVFGVSLAGSPWQLLLVLAAGAVAFTPLGLFLGSVVPNQQAAPAVANAIFFPIIFISGAALPLSALPGWLQEVSRLIPLTYLVEALHAVMLRGVETADLSAHLWILGATGAVGAALDTLLFRWEQREPVRPWRLAVSLAVVGALCAALWALGPELQTRETGWAAPAATSAEAAPPPPAGDAARVSSRGPGPGPRVYQGAATGITGREEPWPLT